MIFCVVRNMDADGVNHTVQYMKEKFLQIEIGNRVEMRRKS